MDYENTFSNIYTMENNTTLSQTQQSYKTIAGQFLQGSISAKKGK